MDWIADNWPWLSFILLGLGKMVRDHIMIADHEQRLDKMEEIVEKQQILTAEQSVDLKHIRHTVDAIAKQQGVNQEDIKKLIKDNN